MADLHNGVPPTSGLLASVRSFFSELSPAEGRLARVLLDDPAFILTASAQTWGERAQVSAATVVRFCRTMGLKGLDDFRLKLAVELSGTVPTLASGIAQQVLQANIQALRETVDLLDVGAIDRAAHELAQASQIEFFAFGLSTPIALDAAYRFQRMGFPANYQMESHMQAVRAASLRPGTVGFVISHSGRAPEALDALRTARELGATVIGLTSSPRSPLALQAQIALIAATSEAQVQAESLSSRIAHLAMVDILCAALSELRPTQTQAALQLSRQAEATLLRRLER